MENQDEVLFQVTKANLDTGLRGYPVGTCVTSTVDPTKGLFYGAKALSDVVDWEPEAVIYLLYYGKEGTKEEVAALAHEIKKRSGISIAFREAITKLPQKSDPMKLFCTALLLASDFQGEHDYREDGLNVMAQIPEIAACVINHHAGWGKTPPSKPELGYMENFAHMLNVPNKTPQMAQVLKKFNILHYDHGGGNLSAFVGKAVASGLEDMYGSLAAAMCALSGPRHGRANQECLQFTQETLKAVGHDAKEEDVEKFIRQKLANGELVFGFGHAVLRVEDPRATLQYAMGQKLYPNDPLVKIALLIRKSGTKVLKENPKIACPYPNVDAMSGVLLCASGFAYPQYFTLLFGVARVVGIGIQIIDERLEAREGKGTPIVRPKYIYKPRGNKS
jgi:citrate synthase